MQSCRLKIIHQLHLVDRHKIAYGLNLYDDFIINH